MLQRLLDILVSAIMALLGLPLLLLGAMCVWLIDPGPVFALERRLGFGGNVLRVWRLRTTYVESAAILAQHLAQHPSLIPQWERTGELENDPRVIATIGDVLRRYRIDDLPLLWNVLNGDMTLVGPRALALDEAECLSPEACRTVCAVRPGLLTFRRSYRYSRSPLRLSSLKG